MLRWLAARPAWRHGLYGAPRHAPRRARRELVPGTLRVITARMNYWPRDDAARRARDACSTTARARTSSRYALGRDYHKVLRARLQQLADAHRAREVGPFGYRVFTDSAPVLEVALAAQERASAGAASTRCCSRATPARMFFLGEIYTDLPLPVDAARDDALRHVHALHRRVPDAAPSSRPTSSTRAAASRT